MSLYVMDTDLLSLSLKRMNLNVRKMDLRISAVVLEHGGVLVTRNVRDFQRVPGLPIEDWSSSS